ncbi:CPBP family intramembrane glutamic endopeptidase [Halobacterium yunchengense]|uniref:CPBP family intramembrane glutamic endopeptidase n=1 Tax=Halobacterium yunchengense TaxID=3108497 RepID=UPI0030082515
MGDTARGSFARRFGATFAAGLPGVAALVAWVYGTTDAADVPVELTATTYAVLSAVNPLLLLAASCAVGAYAAPRVGFESHLTRRVERGDAVWPRLREEVRLAVGLGLAGSVAVVLVDVALAPFVAQDLAALGADAGTLGGVLAYVPVRFLYGGVTEELLLRYGVMSAVAFAGWRLRGSPAAGPSRGVAWAAIVVAAALFGVGHLPALAASVALTPALVARTVLLNAVAGVVFGWLFWRRSLEAAVVAHATFHVPLVLLSLAQVALAA